MTFQPGDAVLIPTTTAPLSGRILEEPTPEVYVVALEVEGLASSVTLPGWCLTIPPSGASDA